MTAGVLAAIVCSALLASGALGGAVWAWRDLRRAALRLEGRRLDIEERRLRLDESRGAASLDPEEMPVDLLMRCEQETEEWAREQLRSLVRQLYAQHKNWDSVRLELSKLDMQAVHAEPGWSITRTTA